MVANSLLVLVLVVVLPSSATGAATLVNGGMDDAALSTPAQLPATYTSQAPAGWLSYGNVYIVAQGCCPTGPNPWGLLDSQSGTHYIALQNDGPTTRLQQTITGLTGGTPCQLRFLATHHHTASAAQEQLQVSIGGTTTSQPQWGPTTPARPAGSGQPQVGNWGEYTVDFTPTGSSSLIKFEQKGGGSYKIVMVDNVRVCENPPAGGTCFPPPPPPPGLQTISPTYGPMEGNTLLMLVGIYTNAVIAPSVTKECQFGTSKTTATVINNTHLSCRTPKHSTGAATFSLLFNTAPDPVSSSFTFFPSMFVSDFKTSSIVRYNADTGAFFDVFVQPRSGGLYGPYGTAFGLDHNFYVASSGTNSVLVYDGSTGAFLKKFCTVLGQPRSLVFHYWDLYVASHQQNKVYRFNGYTGSPRGIYAEGGGLSSPFGLIFDKYTNDTYISSQLKDHVFRFKQPTWGLYGGYGSPSTNGGIHVAGAYNPATQFANPQGMGISNGLGEEITHNAQQLKLGVNTWKGRFDKVWTNTRVNYANGIDLTVDSMYVTGPYAGRAIVRFNRTTGEYMHHFEDEYLNYPVDIKEFRDYLYVCSEDQVRKYNRLNGEFIKTHSQTDGLLGSFLLFHINWNQNLGE